MSTESTISDTPTIDSLLAITQADDPDLIVAQTNEQNAVLEAQQAGRPLAAAQHALDVKVEELAASSESESEEDEELYGDKVSNHHVTPPPSPNKQSLLKNDDNELSRLTTVLKNVWEAFYDGYKKNVEEVQREKQLSRLEGRVKSVTETGKIPDIRDIMTHMRNVILDGAIIVFTGVIPLTLNWQTYPHF
jgi:RNA polymerase II subunit A C-terminal domain phosphatase